MRYWKSQAGVSLLFSLFRVLSQFLKMIYSVLSRVFLSLLRVLSVSIRNYCCGFGRPHVCPFPSSDLQIITIISISNLLVELYTFASNWGVVWAILPLPHAHQKTWVADYVSVTLFHQIICWRFSLFNIYLCFQLSLSHHDLPFSPCPSSDLQSRLFVVGFYGKPPLLPIEFAPPWSSLFPIPIKIPS